MPAMIEEYKKERKQARDEKKPPNLAIPLFPEVFLDNNDDPYVLGSQ